MASSSIDETMTNASEDSSEFVTLLPLSLTSTNEPVAGSSRQETIVDAPILLPPDEPTLQYLQGAITFDQFSKLMELEEEEYEEVAPVIEGVTEVVSTETVHKDIEDPSQTSMGEGEDQEMAEGEDTDILYQEEDQDESDEDVEDDQPRKKRKKRKYTRKSTPKRSGPERRGRPKKRMGDLPKHLTGLMGEANIRFAKGEHQEAIDICTEIIRLAPHASLPFQTLAMMFEEQGEMEKSLQYGLIAAYLNPSDTEQWQRLAEMCLEQEDIKQAIKCITFAIRSNPKNYQLYMDRSKLYEEIGEQRKALEGYKTMLKFMPKEEGEKCMELARSTCKLYFEQGSKVQAMETMQNAFSSNAEHVTSEDVNLLLELLMDQKEYYASLEVLVKHCGVSFLMDNGELWDEFHPIDLNDLKDGKRDLISCTVPSLLPIDLRVKLVVCVLYLRKEDMAEAIVDPLYEERIDDVGDLYLDVAEMYMEVDSYKKAKPLLQRLVCTVQYNMAAVWLRYAECLNKLGEIENAAQAYSQVIELAPSHIGARMSLSSLQHQLGKHEEAIQVLHRGTDEQDKPWTKQEVDLYFHRCLLLYSQGKMEEFYDSCKQLLFNHFKDIEDPSFLKVVSCLRSFKNRSEMLVPYLKSGFRTMNAVKSEVPLDDLWDLYVKMCDMLFEKERYEELLTVTCLGMSNPYFMDDPRKLKQTEFMCFIACLKTKKEHFAFQFIRDMIFREDNENNNQIWNLMNQVLLLATESRHSKFCLRYLLQHPDHVQLSMMDGHNALLSGTYMFALGEYTAVLRNKPNMPLVHLCIGLTFIFIAGQKFTTKKHNLITQGLAFLNNYMHLRGECQEVYYNLGRAVHQLGLTYAAVHYYKKALSFPPVVEDEKGRFDLTRETAHNLMLIYKSSGATELAREIMHKYLTI